MSQLILLAVVFLALHLGVSGTGLRQAIVGRLGEKAFRGLFALAAIVVLVAMCRAYAHAGLTLLWIAPVWLRWLLVLAMLPAFVLFAGSFRANPTAAGGEKLLREDVHGIQRITRHPMLAAIATWAVVHVLGNGDVASLLFFGTLFLTAATGMPSIDRKMAARDPEGWAKLQGRTSILPFAAILANRNKLVPAEIGWIVPAIGIVLWVLVLLLHRSVIGVSPVPL